MKRILKFEDIEVIELTDKNLDSYIIIKFHLPYANKHLNLYSFNTERDRDYYRKMQIIKFVNM